MAGIAELAVIAALAAFFLPSLAQAAPFQGKLDPSFARGGRLRIRLAPTLARSHYATAVPQPDGSLLLGGETQSVHHYKTPEAGAYIESGGFIRRLLPDGSSDPGFHEVVEDETIAGPALQADGKIVFAAGADYKYGEYSGLVHRLDPSGYADRGYGRNGVSAVLPLRPSLVAVDAEGRTVVAGDAGVGGNCHDCVPRPTTALSRLLPNGAVDRSFGTDGTLLLPTVEFDSAVTGLVLAPDGTILVSSGKAIRAVTALGAPDKSFGKEGQVEFEGTIGALTRTGGGDLVAAGSSSDGCCGPGLGGFVVRAYQANGALDPAWGSGGTASIAVADVDYATAVVPTPEGGVMFAGEAATKAEPEGCSPSLPCSFEPYVARLTAGGAIDPAFSASTKQAPGDGDHDSLLAEAPPRVAAIALNRAGGVLLAGRAEETEEATVAALGPSGARDPSFGSEGFAAESRPLPSETSVVGFALGGDGALGLALRTNADDYAERTELRGFTAAGAPIQGYGGGAELPAGVEVDALGSDAAGHVYGIERPFRERARVVRFAGDGRPDPRYGEGGRALLPKHFVLQEMVVRGNGAVLAIGRVGAGDSMALFELTAKGQQNPRFGNHGLALVHWPKGKKATALAASFDRRGRIVVFGSVGNETPLVRLLPDGRLDPTFGHGGRLVYKPLIYIDHNALTIGRDGDIYLSNSGRFRDQTIARFTPDGLPDRSFGEGGRIRVGAGLPVLRLFVGGHRLVLVSGSGIYGDSGWDLRAFHLDGRLDRSFGHGGHVAHRYSHFGPVAAARQSDGRIVLVGNRNPLEAGETVELMRFR